MSKRPKKVFNDNPYPYHYEIDLKIERLTNLGMGIGRDNEWVVQVPFVFPGERIRARIFRNHKNYSEADCLEIIESSPDRVEPKCELLEFVAVANTSHFITKSNLIGSKNRWKNALQKSEVCP